MITKFGKSNPPITQNSIYNTGILDLSIARNNFVNAIASDINVTAPITNFNTFINLIYEHSLQTNLNFWLSGEYTSRSGSIIDFRQDIDKIYFYSKNKDYSGQYLQYKNYQAKSFFNSIEFIDNTSFYYHLEADKVFPLNGQDKTYIIVMSSIDDGTDFLDYTFSTNENDWLFHYGLDFSNSLQPTCEGLCFTYDESDSGNGKLLSLNTGGNNNLITSSNTNIKDKGLFTIRVNNSNTLNNNVSPRQIKTKYNNIFPLELISEIYMDNASDIKSGNGFFLNSHVINNSISNTTVSYNNMRNWRLYEFMVFDKVLSSLEETYMYNYLNSKYGLVI